MRLSIAAAAILIFALCCRNVHAQPLTADDPPDALNWRLPTAIRPSHYNLSLTPHLTGSADDLPPSTFDGAVNITLSTSQANQSQIVLHALELHFTSEPSLSVESTTSSSSIVESWTLDNVTQQLRLRLTQPLLRDVAYRLHFAYTGELRSDMNGFYRSSYVQNGRTHWLATTQLQATHARRLLPCFDEPAFKARFTVAVQRPASFAPTLSNGELIASEVVGGVPELVREHFQTTPPMSTYLLAVHVSEFRMRETPDGTFGVQARPDAYAQTEYAFDVGRQLLAVFDEWTAYNYTSVEGVTKMHMVALPDFSAGAMENWGLLTYRETSLLYSPEDSTAMAKQRVASVIAHEQAHQWFGDLVTCDWWSDTWLNEGFARFFTYFGTALVERGWALELQFVVEQMHVVMLMDSGERARSLTFEVSTPAEIWAQFDAISYNKGASVLRMVEHVMGRERFQMAVRKYLRDNALKTSTPQALYSALQSQSGDINIARLMDAWTTLAGYPVVNVARVNASHVSLAQERFHLKRSVGESAVDDDSELWSIPLSYAQSDEGAEAFFRTKPRLTMAGRQQSVVMSNKTRWTIFNVQQTGYYRVNYQPDMWTNIGTALKANNHSEIHVLNRAQIVDDVLNLARANYVNYTLALDTVQYLEKEEHYIPWLAALNNLDYVYRRIGDENITEYKKWIINLSDHAFRELTLDPSANDTQLDIYNRVSILSHRCKFGNRECIEAAQKRFEPLMTDDSETVPVDVRSFVYCTAIAEGDERVWLVLWQRFLRANVAAEQVLILQALGCTRHAPTLIGYLGRIASPAVRQQDRAAAYKAAHTAQPENVQTVLEYVLANHTEVEQALGSASRVATILRNLAALFRSDEQIERLREFCAQNEEFGAMRGLRVAIEDAEFNRRWADEHVPQIVEWMRLKNGAVSVGAGRWSAVLAVMLSVVLAIMRGD